MERPCSIGDSLRERAFVTAYGCSVKAHRGVCLRVWTIKAGAVRQTIDRLGTN